MGQGTGRKRWREECNSSERGGVCVRPLSFATAGEPHEEEQDYDYDDDESSEDDADDRLRKKILSLGKNELYMNTINMCHNHT